MSELEKRQARARRFGTQGHSQEVELRQARERKRVLPNPDDEVAKKKLRLPRGAVKAISSLTKDKFGLKQLSASDIVFLEGDSEYSTPKLIDSYIIEGQQSTGSNFRHICDLVLSIAASFEYKRASLLSSVIAFMDFLLDSKSEEKILCHPFFMSRAQILDYIFRIRYAMRDTKFVLNVTMDDIQNDSSAPKGWQQCFRRCKFMINQLAFRKYGHTIEDFIVCIRDAAEHQFGKKFEFIGEVINAFPKLLPLIYEKHGGL